MTHRQSATVSISVNGGSPNTSDDNVTYNSVVVLENTINSGVEQYVWRIISKPTNSSAALTASSWNETVDGYYSPLETKGEVLNSTSVKAPIEIGEPYSIITVKVGSTNYYTPTSYVDNDNKTIKNLNSLPGGTTEVDLVFSPRNPANSFTADTYGTFLIELTLNGYTKKTIGASVRSQYLSMRLPGIYEKEEFDGGWGKSVFDAIIALEDGYNTVASSSGVGALSGDLNGSLPDPTVTGIQGNPVSGSIPSTGDGLVWNGSYWAPTPVSSGGSAGGDLNGTYPNPTVVGLQGNSISTTSPSGNQVLAWNGSLWAPADPGTPGAHSSSHENGGADEINVGGLSGVLADGQNASKLQNRNVASTAPSSGHVLTWNGSAWAPVAPTGGAHAVGGSQHIADTLAGFNTKIADADLIATTTTAGGDLSGTYPNPDVAKLQNYSLSLSGTPSDEDVLKWDSGSNAFIIGALGAVGTAGGDLNGTYPDPTVDGLQGRAVASSAPSDGNVLTWSTSNNQWEPAASSGGSGTLNHFLVFSDDTEFTETGTTPVTKKSFRIVVPTGYANSHWLVVLSYWVTGGYGDNARVTFEVGGTPLMVFVTNASSELVVTSIPITSLSTPGTLETVNFKLHAQYGTDTAHLKYTDLYMVFS